MASVPRIDIRKVNDKGRYVDLATNTIFDLTDEQILTLREYYHDDTIARNRRIRSTYDKESDHTLRERYQSGASSHAKHSRVNYRVTREQKYNTGRHRTKQKPARVGSYLFIVGSIVVFLGVGSKLLGFMDGQAVNQIDVSLPEYTSSVSMQDTLSLEGVSTLDLLEATGADVSRKDENLEYGETGNTYDATMYSSDNYVEEEVSNYTEREQLIQSICNIYQVNYDVVYQRLVELTDNFSNDAYLSGSIPGVTCKGVQVQASSEEELLVYAIRCMKQLPQQLCVDTTNLYVHNGYTSGTDYTTQLSHVADVLGVDRCLLYAIVQSESGFDSDIFNDKNNPAGIKAPDGSWWVFDTKEEGFFELGMEVLKYYRKIGVTPEHVDYQTLTQIRDIHAPLVDNNDTWLPNVSSNLEYAKMNEAELFGSYSQNNGLFR